MKASSTFTVGKHNYEVNMWHPDKAIENLTWLTKLAGEPLLAVIVNVGSISDLMDSDVDLTLLTPAVKHLMQNLDEKEVVIKVNQFVADLMVDNSPCIYVTHFLGRPGHLMKVLVQILKAQYADFFEEIPASIQAAQKAKAGVASNTIPAH